MVFGSFGRDRFDVEGNVIPRKSPVEEFAKLTSARVDSITLQLALREHYETYYEICDHNAKGLSPLALVTMHTKERYEPYSRYQTLANNFVNYGIKELFGYNLTRFLELPRVKINTLMEIAAARKRQRAHVVAQENKSLEANLERDVFGTDR